MDKPDLELGMDSNITRRDFIDGAALTIAGLMAAPAIVVAATSSPDAASPVVGADYPPMRQGMRGFDPQAVEAGHAIRDGKALGVATDTGEAYDLIVVGAGMSGLAAAYFYRKEIPDAKILLLEACDDFGGTARRNEFNVNGKQLLMNGGSMNIGTARNYTVACRELMRDVGIDFERAATLSNNSPFQQISPDLQTGMYFAKETFGVDRFVLNPTIGGTMGFISSSPEREKLVSFLAQAPFSDAVRADFVRVYADKVDYMPGVPVAEKIKQLRKMSYIDYLNKVAKVHPEVTAWFQRIGTGLLTSQSSGPDTMSAWAAYNRSVPGFLGMGLPEAKQPNRPRGAGGREASISFPDGNHGLGRLIVRWLIPDALPGNTMEDSVSGRLNYAVLDRPQNDVRLRLSSAVARVKHLGDTLTSKEVEVTYLNGGKPFTVRGDTAVLACHNAVIPYIVPDLPEPQKEGLRWCVRDVACWVAVAIRNWHAFKKLGVESIDCPGMFFENIGMMPRPEWGGAYKNPKTPDDPVIVLMPLTTKILEKPGSGLPPPDQWRASRTELLAIPFETFERNARSQLDRVLGPGGFNSKRDIAGIIINRWGHAMARGSNELYDPDWSHRTDAPWIVGRQRFGRIAISNSDSSGIALTATAMSQSHRAVQELVMNIVRPPYGGSHYGERDGAPEDEPSNF